MKTNIDNYQKSVRTVLFKQFEHKKDFILLTVHHMKMSIKFKNLFIV